MRGMRYVHETFALSRILTEEQEPCPIESSAEVLLNSNHVDPIRREFGRATFMRFIMFAGLQKDSISCNIDTARLI